MRSGYNSTTEQCCVVKGIFTSSQRLDSIHREVCGNINFNLVFKGILYPDLLTTSGNSHTLQLFKRRLLEEQTAPASCNSEQNPHTVLLKHTCCFPQKVSGTGNSAFVYVSENQYCIHKHNRLYLTNYYLPLPTSLISLQRHLCFSYENMNFNRNLWKAPEGCEQDCCPA